MVVLLATVAASCSESRASWFVEAREPNKGWVIKTDGWSWDAVAPSVDEATGCGGERRCTVCSSCCTRAISTWTVAASLVTVPCRDSSWGDASLGCLATGSGSSLGVRLELRRALASLFV